MRFLACFAGWILAGCLTDVKLGDLPPDASTPFFADDARAADAGPFADAATFDDAAALPDDAALRPDASEENYQLSFYGPPDVMCIDALAGQESQFYAVSAEDCGLVGGAIALTKVSTRAWTLAGAPIQATFYRPSLRLTTGVFPDQHDEVLVSSVYYTGGGPMWTERRTGGVAVDRRTETAASVDGFVGIELAKPDDTGSCFMTFGLRLDRF